MAINLVKELSKVFDHFPNYFLLCDQLIYWRKH